MRDPADEQISVSCDRTPRLAEGDGRAHSAAQTRNTQCDYYRNTTIYGRKTMTSFMQAGFTQARAAGFAAAI